VFVCVDGTDTTGGMSPSLAPSRSPYTPSLTSQPGGNVSPASSLSVMKIFLAVDSSPKTAEYTSRFEVFPVRQAAYSIGPTYEEEDTCVIGPT
jgi:hypothetical protein